MTDAMESGSDAFQLLGVLDGRGQLGQHVALQQLAPRVCGVQRLAPDVTAGEHEELEDVVGDGRLGRGEVLERVKRGPPLAEHPQPQDQVVVSRAGSPARDTTDNLCEGRISPAQDRHLMAHSSSRGRPNNGRPASAARNPYAAIAATITRIRTDGNTYQREKSRDGTPVQISAKTLSATATRKMPYRRISEIHTAA